MNLITHFVRPNFHFVKTELNSNIIMIIVFLSLLGFISWNIIDIHLSKEFCKSEGGHPHEAGCVINNKYYEDYKKTNGMRGLLDG